MGRLAGRSLGLCLGWVRRGALLRPRRRLTGTRTSDRALDGGTVRRGRLHRSRHRLHRLPRSEAKRTSKANRIHPRSVEQFTVLCPMQDCEGWFSFQPNDADLSLGAPVEGKPREYLSLRVPRP